MPRNLDDLISEAKELARRGEKDKALLRAIELTEEYPDNVSTWSLRSFIHALKSNYTHAISDISRAIDLNPESRFFFARGRYNFHLGNNQAAVKDFSEGLVYENYGDDSYRQELYFWRAEALIRLGNKSEALSDLFQICDDKQSWTYELRSKSDLLFDCNRLNQR